MNYDHQTARGGEDLPSADIFLIVQGVACPLRGGRRRAGQIARPGDPLVGGGRAQVHLHQRRGRTGGRLGQQGRRHGIGPHRLIASLGDHGGQRGDVHGDLGDLERNARGAGERVAQGLVPGGLRSAQQSRPPRGRRPRCARPAGRSARAAWWPGPPPHVPRPSPRARPGPPSQPGPRPSRARPRRSSRRPASAPPRTPRPAARRAAGPCIRGRRAPVMPVPSPFARARIPTAYPFSSEILSASAALCGRRVVLARQPRHLGVREQRVRLEAQQVGAPHDPQPPLRGLERDAREAVGRLEACPHGQPRRGDAGVAACPLVLHGLQRLVRVPRRGPGRAAPPRAGRPSRPASCPAPSPPAPPSCRAAPALPPPGRRRPARGARGCAWTTAPCNAGPALR